MNTILAVAGGTLAVNLPFGFWRSATRRFSGPWFAAVHLPVLIVVGLRLYFHVDWHLATLPLFVGAYLAGQYLGGLLRRIRKPSAGKPC